MPRRVAITGAGGQLGRQLVHAFGQATDEVLGLTRPDFDITRDPDLRHLTEWGPDVVINSAAWTDVDGCAREPERAMRINGYAAGAVAEAARRAGALIVQISTNEVFDGASDRPYNEEDPPNPINPYGASKLAGERFVVAANRRHLIVRTAWLFGPEGENYVTKIRAAAARAWAAGQPLQVVEDEWGNPTPTPWLAVAIRDVLRRREPADASLSVCHLVGEPATSRLNWARRILLHDPVEIRGIALSDYPRASQVPPRAVLSMVRSASFGVVPGDWMRATAELVASSR